MSPFYGEGHPIGSEVKEHLGGTLAKRDSALLATSVHDHRALSVLPLLVSLSTHLEGIALLREDDPVGLLRRGGSPVTAIGRDGKGLLRSPLSEGKARRGEL